jgi:hypothetical protein
MFMRYQDKYLGAPQRQSMDIQKDSSQMASYLVPSLQNGNQQAPIQPQKSLFGSTNTFAKPIAPITTTTTNSLFGNSLGSIAPKRSNSLGPDTKRAFGG